MNDEPFAVQANEDFVTASDYLNPRNYLPRVTFAVYGLKEAKPEDAEDMQMDELVEKGYAVPLLGFQGYLFLAKDLFIQGFSPRAYIEELAPEYAAIPDILLASQDIEEELLVEDTPNLFIIERMDILSPAVFEIFEDVFAKLQLNLLSLFHVTVQVLLFATPPLKQMLEHSSMLSIPEFESYLKNLTVSDKVIYVEEWAEPEPVEDKKPSEPPVFENDEEAEEFEYKMVLSSLFFMLGFERMGDPDADFMFRDISSQMERDYEI